MQRARQKMFPPPPEDLEGLTQILQNPRFQVATATHDGDDNLYAGSVTAEDGSHHVIFMTRRMARVGCTFSYLFADGTFKVLPAIDSLDAASQVQHCLCKCFNNFNSIYMPLTYILLLQVFAIVGNWDHTVIPIGWVLMECRTRVAYEAVLRTLRLFFRGARNLERVVTDFEPGMQRAFANIFPDAHLQGCFFHFVRVSF